MGYVARIMKGGDGFCSACINKLCSQIHIRNGKICSSPGVDVTCPTPLLQHDIRLL
jgi:hypothetical protein